MSLFTEILIIFSIVSALVCVFLVALLDERRSRQIFIKRMELLETQSKAIIYLLNNK